MAIGDAVGQFMGTALTSRQPAVGVEEQITSIIKTGETDGFELDTGSLQRGIMVGAAVTNRVIGDAAGSRHSLFNTAIMITNSLFITKLGTIDIVVVTGVQTNV